MIATATENTKNAWLGEFPANWEVLRIKNLFQEIDSRSKTGNEELLSVSQYTGITYKRDSLENEDDHLTNAESLVGYKLVEKGDLVINIMLAWNGSLGVSPYCGITSPAYCVYRIKGDNNPEYFGYLFTTNLFKAEFRRNSTGIIDSRLRLYSDKFFSIFSLVPPKKEQDEIVQYIKAQEEKINLFIQKKQRFIELLEEQRQGIINKVVTKGIDATAKFKASGIEWLGDIPENCEVTKLKRLLLGMIDTEHKTVEFIDDGKYFVVRTSNIKGGKLVFDNAMYTDKKGFDEWTKRGIPNPGDILFTREAPAGEACVAPTVLNFCLGQRVVWLKIDKEKLNADFGVHSIYSDLARQFIANISIGSTVAHFNMSDIGSIPLIIPPLEVQNEIVKFIITETTTIDSAIAKTEREIELIREYKEAMIVEAVMGKNKLTQWKNIT
jgi:type I restriction enzyme, S subunit